MDERLNFYKIDADYIRYLKQAEIARYGKSNVPNVVYAPGKKEKFMCGIVLKIGDNNYVAPVTSYNIQKPDNFLLRDNDGNVTSSLRFNYMFPVAEGTYTLYDFNQEVEERYRSVVRQEWNCVNQNADEIRQKAQTTYQRTVELQNRNINISSWACDFKLLEGAAQRWHTLTVQASQFWALTGDTNNKKVHDGFSILCDQRSNEWYVLKDGLPKANGKELSIGDSATKDELLAIYADESKASMLEKFPDKNAALDYWRKESAVYDTWRKENPAINQTTINTQNLINDLLAPDFKLPSGSGSGEEHER